MLVEPLRERQAPALAGARSRAARVHSLPLDGPALRGAAFLLVSLIASGASAEFSGTASLVSDYRYRGISLSDDKPAAQVGLAYDDPFGWYAGVFGSTVRLGRPADPGFQTIGYGGFATRLSSNVSVEIGGDYSAFSSTSYYNYGEVFVGLAGDGISARVHYAPRYYGQPSNALYGELNLTKPLYDRFRLVAHAGYLNVRTTHPYDIKTTQNVVDGRVGVATELDLFHIELAWVGASRDYSNTRKNTVVLTILFPF